MNVNVQKFTKSEHTVKGLKKLRLSGKSWRLSQTWKVKLDNSEQNLREGNNKSGKHYT